MRYTMGATALLSAALGCLAIAAAAAAPDGDSTKGKEIATNGSSAGVPACSACHGAKGEGQAAAGIPRLAGLNDTYLDHQLVAFGNGTRSNPMMTPIAKTMDAATMADAAAYYASLAAPTAVPDPTTKVHPQVARGETIALHGNWAASVPACASCHGTHGLGVGVSFPPIADQSATYISNELQAWKAGTRHDDPLGLMKAIAGRLDDAQIAAVSAYYATLPGAPTTAIRAGTGNQP